jgi:hypothetical protein
MPVVSDQVATIPNDKKAPPTNQVKKRKNTWSARRLDNREGPSVLSANRRRLANAG